VKNYNKGKSGRKDLGLRTGRKKGVHFFGKGYCENVRERSSEEKEEQKRVNCKIKMLIIFIKGSCVEIPLYTMCWATRTVIRDKL